MQLVNKPLGYIAMRFTSVSISCCYRHRTTMLQLTLLDLFLALTVCA